MKKYRILLYLFAVGLMLITACKKDSDIALPDGMKSGVIATITKTANCDGSVNMFELDELSLDFVIKIEDGEYSNIDLNVVFNADYENQYIVKSSISEGALGVNMADLVAAIDELNSSADVEAGDLFNFFLTVTSTDGDVYSAYLPTGKPAYGPNMQNNPNHNFNVNILAAYPYLPENFVGYTFHVVETALADASVSEYDVLIEVDPDNPDFGLRIWDLWWTSDGESDSYYTIYVDPDTYEVLANPTEGEDGQIIWGGNAYGEYGRIAFEDIRAGLMNTANFVITFIVTPTLPDTGYWWGTEVEYVITRIGKDSSTEEREIVSSKVVKK